MTLPRASDHPRRGFRGAPIFTLSLPGDCLHVSPPHYEPDLDTFYITLHTSDWSHSVRLVIAGSDEQRRALDALAPLAAALRRRLGLPEAA